MEAQNGEHSAEFLALDDPAFFRYWSELRQRLALAGKSVSCELKREYAAVSAEYRRRVNGEP